MFKKIHLLFIGIFLLGSFNSTFAQKELWYIDEITGEVRTDYDAYIRGQLKMGGLIDVPELRLNGIPIVSSQWTTATNGNIIFNNGSVGIGVSPFFELDVNGIINANDIYKNGNPFLPSQWTSVGNNIFFNNGNIGIGTNAPAAPLHLHNGSIKFTDDDFSNFTIGIGGISPYMSLGPLSGGKLFIFHNGNVSIGDQDVTNYKLYVDGTINASEIYKNGSPLQASQWTSNGNNVYYNIGNIGLGTIAPSAKLHLNNGTFRLSAVDIPDPGAGDFIQVDYDFVPTLNHLNINNSMYVKPNGNVGIGTSSPNYKLSVDGIVNATEIYKNGSAIQSSQWTTSGNKIYYNTGNVGVGVTNPQYKLHVNGTINATEIYKNGAPLSTSQWSTNETNVYYNNGNIGIGTDVPKAKLHVTHDIALGNDINGQKFILHSRHNASNGDFIQLTCDDASGNWNWNKGITFVRSTGNVGIGTTNPSQKFTVNGTILSKEVLVSINTNDWPDYVFESEYNIMPLESLEEYVKVNKHLPEIESADEIKEKGLLLGDMQVKLLKKIEELTLYIIDINKEKESFKSELDKLKSQLEELSKK